MRMNFSKNMIAGLAMALASLSFNSEAKAGAIDYISGCLVSSAGGLIGTAVANSKLEKGQRIETAGYAASFALTCLIGIGYVGIATSQATSDAEYELKKENLELNYTVRTMAREKCLLLGTCGIGTGIIMESEPEVTKQGGQIIRSSVSTIEVNE